MRKQRSGEQKRSRGVPAVELISHMESAADDGLERDAARAPNGLGKDRRYDVVHIAEAITHAIVVDAVVKPTRVRSLVKITVTSVAEPSIADDKNRHRGGIDTGQRPHRPMVVTATEPDLAPAQLFDRVAMILGKALEERAAD